MRYSMFKAFAVLFACSSSFACADQRMSAPTGIRIFSVCDIASIPKSQLGISGIVAAVLVPNIGTTGTALVDNRCPHAFLNVDSTFKGDESVEEFWKQMGRDSFKFGLQHFVYLVRLKCRIVSNKYDGAAVATVAIESVLTATVHAGDETAVSVQ